MSVSISSKSRVCLTLVRACYVLMLLILVVTSLPSLLPAGASPIVVSTVKLVPLMLMLPGLVADRLRAYIWLCFVVLFYFMHSSTAWYLSGGDAFPVFMTVLTVIVFVAAMLRVKYERALGRDL